MVRISGINSLNFGANTNLYTKREKLDNSEMYINSKLSAVYQRTIADCFVASKLNSIRQFTGTANTTPAKPSEKTTGKSFDKTA